MVPTEPLLLVAAGGLARETLAAIRAGGVYHAAGLVDDDANLHGTTVGGVGVIGPVEMAASYGDVRLVVCAGPGRSRETIVRRLGALGIGAPRFATIQHPSVTMGAECRIGPGSVLLAHVALTADVTVGSHVVAMPNVTVTHDNVVEDFATLCAGASLGGGVRVGRGSYIGMNASVRQWVRVGNSCVVGMGAVVLNDVADGTVVVGNPAHEAPRRTAIGAQRRGSSTGATESGEGR